MHMPPLKISDNSQAGKQLNCNRMISSLLLFLAFLTWLASMCWIWEIIGIVGTVLGLIISALITSLVVWTFFWLGRWMPARMSSLHSAFVWGASVAAFCSIWSQEGLQVLIDMYAGEDVSRWFRPLIITPITEEAFKAVFLLWMLLKNKFEIRGLLSGVVYAGLIGAGFASTEQTLYFGKIMVSFIESSPNETEALTTLVMSFLLRGALVPYMHPLFVIITGLGISVAAGIKSYIKRWIVVLLALLTATILHGAWDWAGLASDDHFLIIKIYAFGMFPLFLVLFTFALRLRQKQGKALVSGLARLAQEEYIKQEDILNFSNLIERRRSIDEAARDGGFKARRLARELQLHISVLALGINDDFPLTKDAKFNESVFVIESLREELKVTVKAFKSS